MTQTYSPSGESTAVDRSIIGWLVPGGQTGIGELLPATQFVPRKRESTEPTSETRIGESTDTVADGETQAKLLARSEFLSGELTRARAALDSFENERLGRIADAVMNDASVFILMKCAEIGRLHVNALVEQLEAPFGWLALAALWRAELVDCRGVEVLVTSRGEQLLVDLKQTNHRG